MGLLSKVFPPAVKGTYDWFFRPSKREGFGGPLNNQTGRQVIVEAILARVDFARIIETGTFRGSTTSFFARHFQGPIHTIEVNAEFAAYAGWRLRSLSQVRLIRADSVAGLRRLGADPGITAGPCFFYLDAHWEEYLPLADELALIFGAWDEAVILIDDFRVPDDEGYNYDDYGPGKVLETAYLDRLEDQDFRLFFPAMSSARETGHKRGSAVITRGAAMHEAVSGLTQVLRAGDGYRAGRIEAA